MKMKSIVAAFIGLLLFSSVTASAQNVFKKGYQGNVEVGSLFADNLYATVSTVHGFSTGKGMFIGVGAVADLSLADLSGIPDFYASHPRPFCGGTMAGGFADCRFGFGNAESKLKLSLDAKLGAEYDLTNSTLVLFGRPSLGISFGNITISGGVQAAAGKYPCSIIVGEGETDMYTAILGFAGVSFSF